jgi:hypothetical protein
MNPKSPEYQMFQEKDKLRKVANYMSAHDNEGILVLKPGS